MRPKSIPLVTRTLVVALALTALAPAAALGGFNPADVRTTTRFTPPTIFNAAADGRLFPGDPLIGLQVVETRIYWDVTVADGHDAARIKADTLLPITTDSGFLAGVILDGPVLGWSGSGTFNHFEATDRYNGAFGPAGVGFGFQSWGLPFNAVDILPTSRIEIDYLVPEPSSGTTLLVIAGLAVLTRRRRSIKAAARSN